MSYETISKNSLDLTSNLFKVSPIIFSIFVVTLIFIVMMLIYYSKIKKLKADEAPDGFALLIFMLINYIKQLTFEILGPKFMKITPYFLFLFGYILISNFIGLTGIESPTASVTVTLSLGLIMFFGTFIIGFKYQRIWFIKKYFFAITVKKNNKKICFIPFMVNPLNILGDVTPLISISLRLWGNIFAGSVISTLFYSIPMALTGDNPIIHSPNWMLLIMAPFAPFVNMFVDMLPIVVQTFVFVLLTMVYWTMSKETEEPNYKYIDFDDDFYVKLSNVNTLES